MLLESAEIDSKDNLKSVLLLQSALRFECHGAQVRVRALNNNGDNALSALTQFLQPFLQQRTVDEALFEFASAEPQADEDTRLKTPNVLSVLRCAVQDFSTQQSDTHPFRTFLGGCFAYDLLAMAETLPDVPNGANTCPDYVFYLAQDICVIDHTEQTTTLISNIFSGVETTATEQALHEHWLTRLAEPVSTLQEAHPPTSVQQEVIVSEDKDDAAFCQDVINLKEHILAGDIFQVVPSRTFSLACPSAILAYAELKVQNPSPYMFYLKDEQFELFGASPESALKYTAQTNQVEIYPIAGTRPRGKRSDGTIDHDLDSRIELNLREDLKEKSEHIMLVDLARNDVARVSEPGTRHVKELLKVDRYSHVMHLVSRVVGQLRHDVDALHAYQACMNMGTLVGAPKVSAATLIREVEQQRRGSYGGAVGYLDADGDMDTCIVIRAAFVQDGQAHVQAGAGVVFDSVPQAEADETRAKAQAVINAIISSQGGHA
jgi:anthranilate synthase component 1